MPACPNCSTEYKKSLFSTNQPYNQQVTECIHAFTDSTAAGYCEKCGPAMLDKARTNARGARAGFQEIVQRNLPAIPILSLQAPASWQFRPITLVSGQSVTGTGVFSEFASSWTDLFGAQSNAYNQKIANGELLCRTQLRMKCIELGGNAVLATDIDYAEVGGDKGMLMVCMAGTAVHLEDTSVLGNETSSSLQKLFKAIEDRKALEKYRTMIDGEVYLLAEIPVE
jgi:uncharacterized protein YbjQ (UPF0145 family)